MLCYGFAFAFVGSNDIFESERSNEGLILFRRCCRNVISVFDTREVETSF